MMLYPTNSADRRQQPCTTTIRSRRAHPRHVLDTAALNAYVPNNVGSKSHNELTWNHVVSVFTFFGLLMTALVSLCCWSHFQFIVERRRLAANTEINSQHRRLAKDDKVKVSGAADLGESVYVNGTYEKTTKVPSWFSGNQDVTMPFEGGTNYTLSKESGSIVWFPLSPCPANCKKEEFYDKALGKTRLRKKDDTEPSRKDCGQCNGTGKKKDDRQEAARTQDGWNIITGDRPHYLNGTNIIFFCAIQKKWHMCTTDGVQYRADTKEKTLPLSGWHNKNLKNPGKEPVPTLKLTGEP